MGGYLTKGFGQAKTPQFAGSGLYRSFTMKKRFFGIMGIPAVLLVIGMALSGCASTGSGASGKGEVETEMSQTLKNAAVDLVSATGVGQISVDTFTNQFERKFPGLKFSKTSAAQLEFTYEGKEYRMKNSTMPMMFGLSPIMGIKSCAELQ
jgi:hypothetical protein